MLIIRFLFFAYNTLENGGVDLINILFIAYGTGGAEAINETIKALNKTTYNISVVAASYFAYLKIEDAIWIGKEDAHKFIKEGIDLVVSERSNGLMFQRGITRKCKAMGVPNLVLMDVFIPEVSDYNLCFDTLPDYVTAVSDGSYEELLRVGFAAEQIIKLGNPAYMRLNDVVYNRRSTNKPAILFLSQGGDGNAEHGKLVSFLNQNIREFNKHFDKYTLDIKLHPMEEDYRYKWKRAIKELNWNAHLLNTETSIDFLRKHLPIYDLLCGINSTLQIQGQMLGIPSIFEGDDIDNSIDLYKRNIFPISDMDFHYYKTTQIDINKLFKVINLREGEI